MQIVLSAEKGNKMNRSGMIRLASGIWARTDRIDYMSIVTKGTFDYQVLVYLTQPAEHPSIRDSSHKIREDAQHRADILAYDIQALEAE